MTNDGIEITGDAVVALRGLAASRGVELSVVIAAARRDDLERIVLLPELRGTRRPQGRLALLRTLALAPDVTPPRPPIDGKAALAVVKGLPPAPGMEGQ